MMRIPFGFAKDDKKTASRNDDRRLAIFFLSQPGQAGIEDLLYRFPRRRRYNLYEPEASLCLLNKRR
jgi:hypothetical protein